MGALSPCHYQHGTEEKYLWVLERRKKRRRDGREAHATVKIEESDDQ
jgi:hypothetical protein